MSGGAPGGAGPLVRTVSVPGAVLLGLGSILGTGIFVSVGVAAEVAGARVVWAVALAAGVATLNGLSSAQLAAAYPVSGGTYEYGHRTLFPAAGFLAGWTFGVPGVAPLVAGGWASRWRRWASPGAWRAPVRCASQSAARPGRGRRRPGVRPSHG